MIVNRYFKLLLLLPLFWQLACDLGGLTAATPNQTPNPNDRDPGRSFLSCGLMTKSDCERSKDCQYLWSKHGVGSCFSKAELGKSCSEVTSFTLCETPGYAKEVCQYSNTTCRAMTSIVFDARGFDPLTRKHRSGSDWDENNFDIDGLYLGISGQYRDYRGFDVNGRNLRGFDRNGRLANGNERDNRGFDAGGSNISGRFERMPNGDFAHLDSRGFDIDGMYVNGGRRDRFGFDAEGLVVGGNRYDARGFDVNGINRDTGTRLDVQNRDREGLDLDGRDSDGFDPAGKTVFGHKFKVINRNWVSVDDCHQVKDKNGIISLAGPGCLEFAQRQAWVFNDLGLDPEGYYPRLTLAKPGVDESFNAQGYNRAGNNFLGISKARFDQVGYDAIVLDNMGGVNDLTWDRLISNFESDCFTIGEFRHKNTGEIVKQKPDGNWQLTHGRYDSAVLMELDLSSKTTFNNHLKDNWGVTQTEDTLVNNLRKGIYFCRWLYGTGMEKAKKFDELSPVTARISHRLTPINYEKELKDARAGDNSDYLARLEGLLDHDDLLLDAVYDNPEEGYNVRFNSMGVKIPFVLNDALAPGGGGWVKTSLESRRDHLRGFFSAVRRAQVSDDPRLIVADIKVVSYQLYKLSQKLATLDKESRSLALVQFLHGGAHCPDAKRQAADEAYRYYCRDDFDRLTNLSLGNIAAVGIEERIHRSLNGVKVPRFAVWLREKIQQGLGLGLDLSSGFSNAYKEFASKLGLPPIENRFEMAHNVRWSDIEGNFLLNNNSAQAENNYSPKRIYEVVSKDLALALSSMDKMKISELLSNIFGYLDKNPHTGEHSQGIIQSRFEDLVNGQKYLITDLLRRLDFLKLR